MHLILKVNSVPASGPSFFLDWTLTLTRVPSPLQFHCQFLRID